MNDVERIGFFSATLSDDEIYSSELKGPPEAEKYRPLKPLATYSPPEGDRFQFEETIDIYYLPFFPDEEKKGYEIFKTMLFKDMTLIQASNRVGLDKVLGKKYLQYFIQIVTDTIPQSVYNSWHSEIRGAIHVGSKYKSNWKSPFPKRPPIDGTGGVQEATVDDDLLRETAKEVLPQIKYVLNKYQIWGMQKDDVHQLILLSLNRALATYDPDKNGSHFKSYFQLVAERAMINEIDAAKSSRHLALNKAIMSFGKGTKIYDMDRQIEFDRPSKSSDSDALEKLYDFFANLNRLEMYILFYRSRRFSTKQVQLYLRMTEAEILNTYKRIREKRAKAGF